MKPGNILQVAADLKKLVKQRARLEKKLDGARGRERSVDSELHDLHERIREQRKALLSAAGDVVVPL
jgi:predicted  nucleic acid-binding Zn-ribbon protein